MISIPSEHLNQDDILTKVDRFELKRADWRISIEVHQILNGEKKGEFYAAPNLSGTKSSQEFITKGDTLQKVLVECLKKIKSKALNEIFPGLNE